MEALTGWIRHLLASTLPRLIIRVLLCDPAKQAGAALALLGAHVDRTEVARESWRAQAQRRHQQAGTNKRADDMARDAYESTVATGHGNNRYQPRCLM